jgi:hypothetical protein
VGNEATNSGRARSGSKRHATHTHTDAVILNLINNIDNTSIVMVANSISVPVSSLFCLAVGISRRVVDQNDVPAPDAAPREPELVAAAVRRVRRQNRRPGVVGVDQRQAGDFICQVAPDPSDQGTVPVRDGDVPGVAATWVLLSRGATHLPEPFSARPG